MGVQTMIFCEGLLSGLSRSAMVKQLNEVNSWNAVSSVIKMQMEIVNCTFCMLET